MKKVYLFGQICALLFIVSFLSACSAQSQSKAAEKPETILLKLKEKEHLPVAMRIAHYYQLKKENPPGYTVQDEEQLNLYGYSLLWDNKVMDAIEIFKLVVSEFPNSSNAYDSLGEAYLANGNKKLSLENYQKSLALNPDNFGAEDQIEKIKYPDRKPETPAEKFVKVFSKQAYHEDLDQLGNKLIEVNPSALKFISKRDFWQIIEEKKALITDQTTFAEFRWHCNEIVASINCSHTSTGGFFPENRMLPQSLRFPLQTRWVSDRLFVIDPLQNTGTVTLKDEILKINGIAVSTIMSDIYKHIPSQGYIETTKNHFFNTWSTGLIPYALGFPETYEIYLKGKDTPLVLNPAKTSKDPLSDPSIKSCQNNLCLEFLDNNKTAILTVSSFNYYRWNNLKVFEEFMDNTFKEIQEKGAKNLILDLRLNGGGSPESAIYLLRYLSEKPFTYFSSTEYSEGEGVQEPFDKAFTGNSYYIIDGKGNSTTGHFMSMVKVLKLGTIVGEELGSNQFCTGGQTICRLSHTKLEYYVGNNANETTATSLPDERGILPDHYVTQSIEDYLNKVDAVKEFTLKLIE